MNRADRNEAIAIVTTIAGLLKAISGPDTQTNAELRLAVENLEGNAEFYLRDGTLGTKLYECFLAAFAAGGTVDGFDRVRLAAAVAKVVGAPAVIVRHACMRMALIQQCRALAIMEFKSRAAVESWLLRLNDAFDPVETYAADLPDQETYQALIQLHAAAARDLATRSRPLPSLVNYRFARPMPALWIVNYLYGHSDRLEEIIDENKISHPLFAPSDGRALTV